MAIWDVQHETMPRAQLAALQTERLIRAVRYAYASSSFYRQRFDEAGVKPADIGSLDDLRRLPFTTKDDFRDAYPYGMVAVPMDEVVRIHSSSGTTGKPVVGAYTVNDMENWTELVARMVVAAGAHKGDIAQISFGYGMFTGGFGLHHGLERVGAAVIPISAGNTARQLKFLQDFGTTILIATPSYALYIGESVQRAGIDPSTLKLRLGMFGAEVCSPQMRREIEARLPIFATDNYGLTEVIGPGVAGECEHRCGMHVGEDHFIVECLDPETGEPVPEGEIGELVFTSLTKEALPIVRYRTRDLCSLTTETCACGRTTARLGAFRGRTDDMFIISGVNVFPSTIERALFEMEGVEPHYLIVLDRKGGQDTFEVQVEVTEQTFDGWMDDLRAFEKRISEQLRSVLLVRPKVTLVEHGTLERTEGKAKRVIDNRT